MALSSRPAGLHGITPLRSPGQSPVFVYLASPVASPGVSSLHGLSSPMMLPTSPPTRGIPMTPANLRVLSSLTQSPTTAAKPRAQPGSRRSSNSSGGHKNAKHNTKNTPSSSPAFVWQGWKYPAGLNRKERRAIMFPQDMRQIPSTGRVRAESYRNGPVTDEVSLEINRQAMAESSGDAAAWSVHPQRAFNREAALCDSADEVSFVGTPVTSSSFDVAYDESQDLPPLMEEGSDDETCSTDEGGEQGVNATCE